MSGTSSAERLVGVSELGERLSSLRLCEPEAVAALQRSLALHGQLTSLVVCAPTEGVLEVIDGFKRLRAARALGLRALRATPLAVDLVQAKVAMRALHEGRSLCELEEGWLVRSLYREDGLAQPEIGRLLGRHKSWVSRRLLLVEALDDAVQADVRLGLLSASAAVVVGQLPRCNQRPLSEVVARTGMTSRQTALLVAELLSCESDEARAGRIREQLVSPSPPRSPPRPARRARTDGEWILADVAVLRRHAAQLEARLLSKPLSALGPRAAELIAAALSALTPALRVLVTTVADAIAKERRDAELEHARGAVAPGDHAARPGPLATGDRAGAGSEPQHGP